MRLLVLAVVVALFGCEEGPIYQSQRCKDLRLRIRGLDAAIERITRNSDGIIPTGIYEAERRTTIEENPECFDPSL